MVGCLSPAHTAQNAPILRVFAKHIDHIEVDDFAGAVETAADKSDTFVDQASEIVRDQSDTLSGTCDF